MEQLATGARGLVLGLIVGIGILLRPQAALAWDGFVTLTPTQIDVTDGGNYGFRVVTTSTAMCGNSNTSAYLNSADSNYSTYVAVILIAKTQQSSIDVYSNRDATGGCHIGYVTLH